MPTYSIHQLATSNIDDYALYSIASVKAYSERYGYQSFVQRAKMMDDMHVNWSKISMMIEALKKSDADYCVMLDSDTVIVNHEIQLDRATPKGRKIISLARDHYYTKYLKPNAGFVIIKNSKEGLELLEQWMHSARNEGKEWADIHPRNQNVYWKYIEPRWKKKQRLLLFFFCRKYHKIYESFLFRKFVFHVTYSDMEKRKEIMERLYKQYVPSANEHLAQIKSMLNTDSDHLQIN